MSHPDTFTHEMIDQRDSARRWAVALEQECAALRTALHNATSGLHERSMVPLGPEDGECICQTCYVASAAYIWPCAAVTVPDATDEIAGDPWC